MNRRASRTKPTTNLEPAVSLTSSASILRSSDDIDCDELSRTIGPTSDANDDAFGDEVPETVELSSVHLRELQTTGTSLEGASTADWGHGQWEATTGIQSCENGVDIAENGIPCRTGGTPFVTGIIGAARLDDLHRLAPVGATHGTHIQ